MCCLTSHVGIGEGCVGLVGISQNEVGAGTFPDRETHKLHTFPLNNNSTELIEEVLKIMLSATLLIQALVAH